jgi:hypothetical protein
MLYRLLSARLGPRGGDDWEGISAAGGSGGMVTLVELVRSLTIKAAEENTFYMLS